MKQYKSWLREHFAEISDEEKLKYYPEIIAQLDEGKEYQWRAIFMVIFFSIIYPVAVCYIMMNPK